MDFNNTPELTLEPEFETVSGENKTQEALQEQKIPTPVLSA